MLRHLRTFAPNYLKSGACGQRSNHMAVGADRLIHLNSPKSLEALQGVLLAIV
jgi:hypothetical protein